MVSENFTIQCNLGQAMITYPEDSSCQAQQRIQQHNLVAGNLYLFKDFNTSDKITLVDDEDDAEAVLVEALKVSGVDMSFSTEPYCRLTRTMIF